MRSHHAERDDYTGDTFMVRLLAIVAILVLADTVRAQDKHFADADKEQNWSEHFDGKTLKDWQATGAVQIKDDLLILGGPPTTTLQLQAPLGKKFKILIECKSDGPASPTLRFETREMLSKGSTAGSILLKPGEWTELLLVGGPDDQGRVMLDVFERSVTDKKTRGQGQFGGRGTPSVSLEVPPGGNLTIRRIRLESGVPAASPAGLFIALAVLGFVILSIIAGGWLLSRREPKSAPPAPGS